MVFGMIPNQQATIKELVRVLKPGGTLAISAHGPEHYREAIEANLKVMTMRYFLDHRFEFWQRDEKEMSNFFLNADLKHISTERLIWTDDFDDGGKAFDFFATTSALWWYERLPKHKREREAKKTREYYRKNKVTSVTSDVVFTFGIKP
jgi:SAM-dependent methyltransferase